MVLLIWLSDGADCLVRNCRGPYPACYEKSRPLATWVTYMAHEFRSRPFPDQLFGGDYSPTDLLFIILSESLKQKTQLNCAWISDPQKLWDTTRGILNWYIVGSFILQHHIINTIRCIGFLSEMYTENIFLDPSFAYWLSLWLFSIQNFKLLSSQI